MRVSRRTIHWVLALAATGFTIFLSVLVGQAARAAGPLAEAPDVVLLYGAPAGRAPLDEAPAGRAPLYGAPQQQQPPTPQPGYVGEETCLTCHSDSTRGYHDSAHGRAANPRAPLAQQGCESCHGPGGQHVEDPLTHPVLRFKAVEPEIASEACLTCHRGGEHALWEGSAHEARSLSCSTCHSIHSSPTRAAGPAAYGAGAAAARAEGVIGGGINGGRGGQAHGTNAQLTTATEMDLCAQCHKPQVVKLDRSGHMPVREGKMACSTCHNVHGATNEKGLRYGTTPAEACATCHADKRGPFLWEHAPVTESCATCHDPHGSANERMLVAKLPMLCQRCHIHTRHPSTIYDGSLMGTSNRLYGRSCVSCHSNIHGSNHASGNMFVR
jgi:predicted CXXCH cytochrome family protein